MRTSTYRRGATTVACLAVALVCALPAVAQQPPSCVQSKFGPNDEVGNLNYVTPEKTLAATKLVTKGKAYRLGIETNKDTPAFPPRTFSITSIFTSPSEKRPTYERPSGVVR